jgi:transposase
MTQPDGPTGVGLLPRRWVVERRFGGAARFRRLARHYERRALSRSPFHFFAFAGLWAAKAVLRLNRP